MQRPSYFRVFLRFVRNSLVRDVTFRVTGARPAKLHEKSGPVIADGHTVGGNAEERILVRHGSSMIGQDRRVYKVLFEG